MQKKTCFCFISERKNLLKVTTKREQNKIKTSFNFAFYLHNRNFVGESGCLLTVKANPKRLHNAEQSKDKADKVA